MTWSPDGDTIGLAAQIWHRPARTDAGVRAKAIRTIAAHASDRAELIDLLQVLGLDKEEAMDGQP